MAIADRRSFNLTEPRFFGQYLVSQGVITPAKLVAAIEFQSKVNIRLGEYAMGRRLLSDWDVKRIAAQQLSEDLLFGQVAVRMGLLERSSVCDLLAAQRLDHVPLGEALIELGYATEEEVCQALAEYSAAEEERRLNPFSIPPEVPIAPCAATYFRLTHLLLQRAWGVRNKPGPARLDAGPLQLSDWNAKVEVTGDMRFTALIAFPSDVAVERACQLYECEDISEVTEDYLSRVARQFISLVCSRLFSKLYRQRITLKTSGLAENVSQLPMNDDGRALVMHYTTSDGQVLAAIIYDDSTAVEKTLLRSIRPIAHKMSIAA
jgi:hypothetical protein